MSDSAPTVNTAIQQGGTFDPNNKTGVNTLATDSAVSSAPPYTPLVGSGYTVGSNGTASLTNVVTGQLQNQAVNPNYQLPANQTFTYKPITNQPQDTLQNYNLPSMNYKPAAQATASYTQLPTNPGTEVYNAAQGVAAHGTVNAPSLVQNQVGYVLSQGTNANGVPDWAQPAVTASNQRANALGLGASTIAEGASTGAILTAALPIAEQNAHTYALMNTQNVTNDQYTMLANTAAKNAAYSTNAKDINQNNQFFAGLTNSTQLSNSKYADNISKYNAGQTNVVNDFNSNLQSGRQEFNNANQLTVDQSNVKWQRSINTTNTASDNAANQANVKNTFNVSQGALNDLWQQARDEASWSLTSSENSQNRGLSLSNSALNRQTSYGLLSSQQSASMYTALGNFGVSLLGGTSGITSGIKSVGAALGIGGTSGTTTGASFSGGGDTMASQGGIITGDTMNGHAGQEGQGLVPVSDKFHVINKASGGFITNPGSANGVDLTTDTPHVSSNSDGSPKVNYGKY